MQKLHGAATLNSHPHKPKRTTPNNFLSPSVILMLNREFHKRFMCQQHSRTHAQRHCNNSIKVIVAFIPKLRGHNAISISYYAGARITLHRKLVSCDALVSFVILKNTLPIRCRRIKIIFVFQIARRKQQKKNQNHEKFIIQTQRAQLHKFNQQKKILDSLQFGRFLIVRHVAMYWQMRVFENV